jgi:hypothetical protein
MYCMLTSALTWSMSPNLYCQILAHLQHINRVSEPQVAVHTYVNNQDLVQLPLPL